MSAVTELRERLFAIALRSFESLPACQNEESTKLHLVLPVMTALGYDFSDPLLVRPEYNADFRTDDANRVDFAICLDDNPVIAIECKKAGSDLTGSRGQLRSYFAALPSVKLGILTNGIVFEFFIDSDVPNLMDAEPFLTLDLSSLAPSVLTNEHLEAIDQICRWNFNPNTVSEIAENILLRKNLRATVLQEFREPSQEFCRLMLQKIGLKRLRGSSIDGHYRGLVKGALEDAILVPVMKEIHETLLARDTKPQDAQRAGRIATTTREIELFNYTKKRLAYLVPDEYHFQLIDRIQYRDYAGKFAVFYENVRKGRLFDFIESSTNGGRILFPEPFGEFSAESMSDLDKPLKETFLSRVRELSPLRPLERAALRA